MKISFTEFNKILNNIFIYEKNPIIAVGVSGGPDSIALTYLLKEWSKKKSGRLIALIVDHRIRKESYFESINTKLYLNEIGIESQILTVSKKIKIKKMSDARNYRFKKLFDFCKKKNIFHLFLAHHFDDNIETFVLRKIAGSNFEGLNCMQQVSIFGSTQIVRPLLNYKKKEIINFNKKHKLKYIEDPSNKNESYSRVLVRNYLRNNKQLSKILNKEFDLIKVNYKDYISMVFYYFNEVVTYIDLKKIVLDLEQFKSLNYEIKVKLIDLFFRYLHKKKINIRYQKIDEIIKFVEKVDILSFNGYHLMLKKNQNLLTITRN